MPNSRPSPLDEALWEQAKSEARRRYRVWPSPPASAYAAGWYKDQGGRWSGQQPERQRLRLSRNVNRNKSRLHMGARMRGTGFSSGGTVSSASAFRSSGSARMPMFKFAGGPGSGITHDNTEQINLAKYRLQMSPAVTIGQRARVMAAHSPSERGVRVPLKRIKYVAQRSYVVKKLAGAVDHHKKWQDTPVELYFDGQDYHVMDGHHRYLAALRLGWPSIRANVWTKLPSDMNKQAAREKNRGRGRALVAGAAALVVGGAHSASASVANLSRDRIYNASDKADRAGKVSDDVFRGVREHIMNSHSSGATYGEETNADRLRGFVSGGSPSTHYNNSTHHVFMSGNNFNSPATLAHEFGHAAQYKGWRKHPMKALRVSTEIGRLAPYVGAFQYARFHHSDPERAKRSAKRSAIIGGASLALGTLGREADATRRGLSFLRKGQKAGSGLSDAAYRAGRKELGLAFATYLPDQLIPMATLGATIGGVALYRRLKKKPASTSSTPSMNKTAAAHQTNDDQPKKRLTVGKRIRNNLFGATVAGGAAVGAKRFHNPRIGRHAAKMEQALADEARQTTPAVRQKVTDFLQSKHKKVKVTRGPGASVYNPISDAVHIGEHQSGLGVLGHEFGHSRQYMGKRRWPQIGIGLAGKALSNAPLVGAYQYAKHHETDPKKARRWAAGSAAVGVAGLVAGHGGSEFGASYRAMKSMRAAQKAGTGLTDEAVKTIGKGLRHAGATYAHHAAIPFTALAGTMAVAGIHKKLKQRAKLKLEGNLAAQRGQKKTASSEEHPKSSVKMQAGAAMAGLGIADRFGYGVLRSDFGHGWEPYPHNPFKGGTPGLLNKGQKGLKRIHGKRWPWMAGGALAGVAAYHGARALRHHSHAQPRRGDGKFDASSSSTKLATSTAQMANVNELVGQAALAANRRLNILHARRIGMVPKVGGQHDFAQRAVKRGGEILSKHAWAAIAGRALAAGSKLLTRIKPPGVSVRQLASNGLASVKHRVGSEIVSAKTLGARGVMQRAGNAARRGMKSPMAKEMAMSAGISGAMGAYTAPEGQKMKGFAHGAAIGAVGGAVSSKVEPWAQKRWAKGPGDGRGTRFMKAVKRNSFVGAPAIIGMGAEGVATKAFGAVGFKAPTQPGMPDAQNNLPKTGATRQVKIMRQLAGAGQFDDLGRMVKKLHKAKVLKMSGPGTALKHLGAGAEGLASIVAGSSHAPAGRIAVRKAYDRHGPLFSKEMLAAKFNLARRMRGKEKDVAETYSKRIGKGKGGGRFTIHEHVRGKEIGPMKAMFDPKTTSKLERVSTAPRGAHADAHLADVAGHPGNTMVARNGRTKVIDFLPSSKKALEEVQKTDANPLDHLGPHAKVKAQKSNDRMMKALGMPGKKTMDSWFADSRGRSMPTMKMPGEDTMVRAGKKAHPYNARIQSARFNKSIIGARSTPSDFSMEGGLRRADKTRSVKGL